MPLWLTTLLSSAVSSVLVPWLVSKGITLDSGSQMAVNASLVGAVTALVSKLHAKFAPASAVKSVTKMAGADANTAAANAAATVKSASK